MADSLVSSKKHDDAILSSPNPFTKAIVGGAWDEIIDVISLNQRISDHAVSLLKSAFGEKRARSMLVLGQPGIGKSHILARLRKLTRSERFLFVQVRPIANPAAIISHIYRETFVSLRKKEPSEEHSPMEELLGKIISFCLTSLLREKQEKIPLRKEVENLLRTLEKDPMAIYRYFGSRKRKRTRPPKILQELVDLTIEYVEERFPEIHPLFIKVLSATLDTKKHRAAMRWLQGDELPEDELKLLQVAKTIDEENLAFRVLSSVFRLTDRPVLLCFDQMESIVDRFNDPYVLSAFFDILVQLYNDAPNICILLMCQTYTWTEKIEGQMQKSALDRVEIRETLETPDLDQVSELVRLRMHPIFTELGDPPPHPTYPFPREYLENVASHYGFNPRHIIRTLAEDIRGMKERELVSAPIWQEPEPEGPPEALKLESFLDEQLSKLVENFKDSLIDNPLKSRENFLEAIFLDLFNILMQENEQLGEWIVTGMQVKRRAGEPDFIVSMMHPGQEPLNIGIEVTNTENGWSFWSILNRFNKALERKKMDGWIVIRDEELLPIRATWKKTIILLESLSETGKIISVDFESNSMLQACKELVDAASAGDLSLGSHIVSRKEAINYVLKRVVPEISTIRDLFELSPKDVSEETIEKKPDEIEIKEKKGIGGLQERIVRFLQAKPVLNVSKCQEDFHVDSKQLHEAVDELKSNGQVVVLKDEPSQLIISRKTEEAIF